MAGRTLHLISAWACETRLVLGQLRVADKSNEISALPELLALLTLDGCIVTADAMSCQKDTAQAILDRRGDDVLALKANQPALFDDVRLPLDDPQAPLDELATTTESAHGRIETRRAVIVHDVAWGHGRGPGTRPPGPRRAEDLARLRRCALNLLPTRAGARPRGKLKRAGWNDPFPPQTSSDS